MLIVFGGLPGTGKTTLARAIARKRRAVYVRIDAIEQALRDSGEMAGPMGPAGYLVGYAMARSNLALGGEVVADSVNPLPVTRAAWRALAAEAGTSVVEIEVICSDRVEHRRRVEQRVVDVPGLVPPSWDAVMQRDYQPWRSALAVIDTATGGVEAAVRSVEAVLPKLILPGDPARP